MNDEIFIGHGVVLRVGELFLKGKNRHIFEQALERNVRRALDGRNDVQVKPVHGRIFVLGAADEDLLGRLRWVFGISSMSAAVFCEKSIETITANAVKMGKDHPARKGDMFRIAARRSDKNFDHNSAEIGRIVGAAGAEATGLGVDLERPNLRIGVEVGVSWTFLWTEQRRGPGGLPVGTSGRAALLLSGGIDSPVAGHLLQKRGLELIGVYFHAFPYTGDGAKNKVIDLARTLAQRQKGFRLYVVSFSKIQELLRDKADASYLVLLYRRAMIRIAQKIAGRERIAALATGESLGQVASQTLTNLSVVQDVATMPILRPLIGFDKAETIELARKIGTYEISILPHDDCCSLFVPKHPETKGHIPKRAAMEAGIDLQPLLDEAFENAELLKL